MRVVTYNVHGWQTPGGESNVDLVGRVLAGVDPDIVGLNEVFHSPGAVAEPPLELLAARLGMSYAFAATQPADPQKHPPYGNALLCRWPIVAHAAHHLAPAVAYGKRGLLECRVRLPSGSAFTVYVTHLDHRSEPIRVEQWASANAWLLRDRSRPHLLLGDFNALAETDYGGAAALARLRAYQVERGWPNPSFDLVNQVIKAGYVDAFAAAGNPPGAGASFPAGAPERRIDYIFLPATISSALRNCATVALPLTAVASDHLPVLAEINV